MVVDGQAGLVELYVQDTGAGMDEQVLEHIFEPFYSTKKHGTGLGLSIVHRIAATQGLSLSVDSQKGYGTTFLIQFKTFGRDDSTEDTLVEGGSL